MIKKTICFSNRVYLSLRNRQIVIHRKTADGIEEEQTRPIEDIGVIVIESQQVTLSSALISALIDNNVAVIFCDSKYMPSGMIMPLAGNSEQSERYNAQIGASQPLKKQLWQQTVSAKILNQAAVLKRANNIERGNMVAWAAKVRSGDPDNLEGRAAAYYWRNLFPEFPEFKRERYEGFPNCLLNYGYSILRGIIARSLAGTGLLPTFGIYHHNRYNAYCLADDIMEPYRPYVDLMVLHIIRNFPEIKYITNESKQFLLTLPTIDVTIRNLRRPLMIAASITTASLAKCYLGENRKISYPDLGEDE